jgi:crossover junction endodeoxyribonuclease RuvC
LVKQYFHALEDEESSRHEALLGVTQNELDLLARDSWEPLQKVINPGTAFEIFEQGPHRYARAFKQPLAADFAGNAFDRWALVPVKHAGDSMGGDVLSQEAPRHAGKHICPPVTIGRKLAVTLCRRPPWVYHRGCMTRAIRILGIDPGLRRTGWGIVEVAGNRLGFLGCGSVTTRDDDALAARLLAIHDGLLRVLGEFRPDEAAVEATFVNKDAKATLKLGQARGIAMVVPARAGVSVAEYAPNLVKKSIVGAGHGDKAQVRMMIGVLLPKADPSSDDAADALAVAVTHAHHRQSMILRVAAR